MLYLVAIVLPPPLPIFGKRANLATVVLYLVAIVVPPLAVLLTGRPAQAVLNVGLTLLLWVPGVFHAFLVVNEHKANERAKKYGHHS